MSALQLPHSRIEVTSEQKDIVDHLHAHSVTVVSAGAGAGKTYTTVAAAVELIAGDQVQADSFVLITFTNHAADELRGRLHAEVAKQVQYAVDPARRAFWLEQRERLSASYIGTIHGFCKQLLSLYGYGQGVAREASVSMSRRLRKASIEAIAIELLKPGVSDPVADVVIKGAWPEYEMREFVDKMLADARNRGIDLTAMLTATERQPGDSGKPIRVRLAELVVEAESRYQLSSNQEQQLDAAALLLRAADLLESEYGDDVVARIAQRFRFLFIDEFQDTSVTQMRIASKLAARVKTVVVGDRKQAIYAFAGANRELAHEVRNAPPDQAATPELIRATQQTLARGPDGAIQVNESQVSRSRRAFAAK